MVTAPAPSETILASEPARSENQSDCEGLLASVNGDEDPSVVQFRLNDVAGAHVSIALVDTDEWLSVSRFRWRLTADGVVNEHGGTLPRFILCPQHDQEVLHLNGDDLDCRRANLRTVDCGPLSVRLKMNLRLLLEKMAAVEGVTVDTIVARLIAREFAHAVR